MAKFHPYSFSILFYLSIGVNHIFTDANPLAGENVSPANDGEFPFVVSFGRRPADTIDKHFCTGTLLSKRHVLTAAHCFDITLRTRAWMDPANIVVTAGSNDVTQGRKHRIIEWKTYHDWALDNNIIVRQFRPFHDIAVVTLRDDVSETIIPAAISTLSLTEIYGQPVVSAGWGHDSRGLVPILLQKAELTVLNRTDCLRRLRALNMSPVIVLNRLCTAAVPSVHMGGGDSGGPIVIDNKVVGVSVSSNPDDLNDPNHLNLHIAVRFYAEYIESAVDMNE